MSTLAGWYDDGSGRLRWWDGGQWTDHFADQTQAPVVAASDGPQAKQSMFAKVKASAASVAAEARSNIGYGASTAVTVRDDAEVTAVVAGDDVPLYEIVSHIDGKNAKVKLWPDRIEWERGRGVSGGKITAGVLTGGLSLLATGVKGGKDAYEMLPINQVTSVSNRKDGMLYHLVEVQTAGGTVGFRVNRDDAAAFRQAILNLMQTRAATPVSVQVSNAVTEPPAVTTTPDHVAQLHQLAQLRDAGILTDDEFASKKQEILSRI
ncbi:DUF2510 domain-containing protein [Leifsonia sp. NPDC056665]|uniref:DUF2510 domain-containing protein n=1 Tax=Leifsonia sp. NPDC056665 TaxID=3345901 RepID=UPI0036B6BC6F